MNELEDIDNETLGEDWSDENKPQAFSGISIFSKSSNLPQNLVKNKILPSIPTYQKYRTAKNHVSIIHILCELNEKYFNRIYCL